MKETRRLRPLYWSFGLPVTNGIPTQKDDNAESVHHGIPELKVYIFVFNITEKMKSQAAHVLSLLCINTTVTTHEQPGISFHWQMYQCTNSAYQKNETKHENSSIIIPNEENAQVTNRLAS